MRPYVPAVSYRAHTIMKLVAVWSFRMAAIFSIPSLYFCNASQVSTRETTRETDVNAALLSQQWPAARQMPGYVGAWPERAHLELLLHDFLHLSG
jgi:hypothetical protein